MFGIITNLTKAAVAVALSPVAVAVDIVRLPITAEEGADHPFQATGSLFNSAAKSVNKAIDGD